MNGEIAGVFIYNDQPRNGATAKLWKITGFAAYAASTATVQDNPLSATAIELNSSDGTVFAVGDIIKVESELMRIWAISTNKLYVIRGYRATTAASHVQTTAINDETVTEPAQDDAEPGGSYQQGGNVTTAVALGGTGAYRFTAVPEGEYYVSVEYDSHRAFLYASVENNDPTPENLLTVRGDIIVRGADGVKRLAVGAVGTTLQSDGTDPAWASVSQPTYVVKASDETVNNSDVLQNDDELLFAMSINKVYEVEIQIRADSATGTPDMKNAVSLPAGAVMRGFSTRRAVTSGIITDALYTGGEMSHYIDAAYNGFVFWATVIVATAGTAGNFQFQWAQNAATVEDTKVLASSFIRYRQLI